MMSSESQEPAKETIQSETPAEITSDAEAAQANSESQSDAGSRDPAKTERDLKQESVPDAVDYQNSSESQTGEGSRDPVKTERDLKRRSANNNDNIIDD